MTVSALEVEGLSGSLKALLRGCFEAGVGLESSLGAVSAQKGHDLVVVVDIRGRHLECVGRHCRRVDMTQWEKADQKREKRHNLSTQITKNIFYGDAFVLRS